MGKPTGLRLVEQLRNLFTTCAASTTYAVDP
jgi:hypothetical protein